MVYSIASGRYLFSRSAIYMTEFGSSLGRSQDISNTIRFKLGYFSLPLFLKACRFMKRKSCSECDVFIMNKMVYSDLDFQTFGLNFSCVSAQQLTITKIILPSSEVYKTRQFKMFLKARLF